MALIDCPDCGVKVSDAAPACPKCSRPMKATTIEATGKQWKVGQLIGGIVLVFGILGIVGSANNPEAASGGVMFTMLGLFLFIASRVGAWWHHG